MKSYFSVKLSRLKDDKPKAIDKKKIRIGLAVMPSVYDKLNKIAFVKHMSLNELAERFVLQGIENSSQALQSYEYIEKVARESL